MQTFGLGYDFPVKRRWKRYQIDLPVAVITQTPKTAVRIGARGGQLNRGGMTLFAGIGLSVNEMVEIEFTPKGTTHPVKLRCVIRNREGYAYGVEFMMQNYADCAAVGQVKALLESLERGGVPAHA